MSVFDKLSFDPECYAATYQELDPKNQLIRDIDAALHEEITRQAYENHVPPSAEVRPIPGQYPDAEGRYLVGWFMPDGRRWAPDQAQRVVP